MTDRFNLSFTNDEHELFLWLQGQKNGSGLLKDLLRAYRNGEQKTAAAAEPDGPSPEVVNALLQTFIGEDIAGYGSEKQFLQYVNRQMINTRVSMLMTVHPAEAVAVITAAKERYPTVGELL